LKGEYVPLLRAVGGQVIRIGHGLHLIAPLDAGALGSVVPVLQQAIAARTGHSQPDREQMRVLEQQLHRAKKEVAAAQRRMIETLVSIARQDRLSDYESAAVAGALNELYAADGPDGQGRGGRPPGPTDLSDR